MFPRILLFVGLTAAAPDVGAETALKPVAYSVADLIVPIPSRPNLEVAPLPCRGKAGKETPQVLKPCRATDGSIHAESGFMPWHGKATCDRIVSSRTLEQDLMHVITSKVSPKSWKDAGGAGTIQYFPLGMALVVTQTPAVQREVAALLAALHRCQDVEVVLEVRMLHLSAEGMKHVRQKMQLVVKERGPIKQTTTPKWIVPARGARWTARLDEDQSRRVLESTQEDMAASIMQTPRITMFDGQIVALEFTEQKFFITGVEVATDDDGNVVYMPRNEPVACGLRLAMKPVVSADRRSVRVEMNGYWSAPAGPLNLMPVQTSVKGKNDKGRPHAESFSMCIGQQPFNQVHLHEKVKLADGETMLFHAGVVPVEVPKHGAEKVASWVFGQSETTSADRHVVFMVTPRIVSAGEP